MTKKSREIKQPRKLTPTLLRRLVKEEKEKYEQDLQKVAADTREVEAEEYADTLEKRIDHLAMLKIKEVKLIEALKSVRAQTKQLRESLIRKS